MSKQQTPIPSLPQLVLRVGFAGNSDLPADPKALGKTSESLSSVFETIIRRIVEIAPGQSMEATLPESRLRNFYSNENPSLRLVTGLCEGADSLAFATLDSLAVSSEILKMIEREHAAVLPFDLSTYRASRPQHFQAEFKRQAEACKYILCLDGRYERPSPDTSQARNYRERAYRAQSAVLLRHSDLLVAVADSTQAARPGGTMETVRAALDFELAVVFIEAGTGQVRFLRPGDDRASTFAALAKEPTEDWTKPMRDWVTGILVGPEPDVDKDAGEQMSEPGEIFLQEFFFHSDIPPTSTQPGKPGRRKSFREWCWTNAESRFRPPVKLIRDPVLKPYEAWRNRASELSAHYSGLYRGAFLLNYLLAALAVAFAALSLALLGIFHDPALLGRLHFVLFGLGVAKLVIVFWIFWNTKQANEGNWNDKSVDYRYLAERLRAMSFLPRIGSFQPPSAAPPQFATRAIRQSAVDWLFDAVVRSISPAELAEAGSQSNGAVMLRLDPMELLKDVRDRWIEGQIRYHDRTKRTMHRIQQLIEKRGKQLNVGVILFVVLDLAILILDIAGVFPEKYAGRLHVATPLLLFLAAFLPVTVASLNGIRFQSECHRLADRSAVVYTILSGRRSKPEDGKKSEADRLIRKIAIAESDTAANPGSWTPEVLFFAESVADVFVREVAEWSVLYTKEIAEP